MPKCRPDCNQHSLKCHLIACEESSLRLDEVDEQIDRHQVNQQYFEMNAGQRQAK